MSTGKFLKAAKKIQEDHVAKKKPKPTLAGHDESNWLISYADLMTLLCGFFIILYSMSPVDPPKYEKFKESIAKQFNGEYTQPAHELARTVTEALAQAGVSDQVSVKSDSLGVSVVFESAMFFDSLSAEVKVEGQRVVGKLIEKVTELQARDKRGYRVVVEGHTDSRPILGGNFPTNWELSGSRAARVVRMFLDQGFDPSRLAAIGYADTRPEHASRTPSGEWDEKALAKNRRVVIRILEPSVESVPLAQAAVSTSAPVVDLAPPTSVVRAPADAAPAPEAVISPPAAKTSP